MPARGPGVGNGTAGAGAVPADTLAEYAGEARQGNGRLVLVSGESGMGKTVLLEAFQQQLRGRALAVGRAATGC